MARKVKGMSEDVNSNVPMAPVIEVPEDAQNPGDRTAKQNTGIYKPYEGRASLPPPIIGKKGLVVGRGEGRFFCYPILGGVDFVEKYRKRGGVGQRLIMTLKDANPKHKAKRIQLRKMHIPGA